MQTYIQHTLLVYIGWRIFLDHPVDGAGWQASSAEQPAYGAYLADAKRKYPDAPALAFPSPAHPWGVQNAYVQALADLGAIGFVLLLASFASGLSSAGARPSRPPRRRPPARSPSRGCSSRWACGRLSASSRASRSTP